MNRKYSVILLLLLGGLTTWFIINNKRSGTSDKSKTSFAVENVEGINKIFLSNKHEGNLLLEKKKDTWYVNNGFEAYKPTMDFFLKETIKKIRVKGTVPLPARENVISSMASTATKVEIYVNNALEKVYYVGQPTNDMTGTYMYLQNSKDPYITHIPGFEGFLSSRYPIDENEWVNLVVFDHKPGEIRSVDVNYPSDINASFTVTRKDTEGDFEITASENAPAGNLNYASVKSYFSLFGFKTCEGIANFEPLKFAALLKTTPVCVITLTDTKNKNTQVRVYKRVAGERDHTISDKEGKRLVHDPTRYNAMVNNEKRVMVIQDLVFAPIMIKYSDFFVKVKSD